MTAGRWSVVVCCLLSAAGAAAREAHDVPAGPRVFRHPALDASPLTRPASDLPPAIAAPALAGLTRLHATRENALYDLRGGHWSSLVLSQPLLPGTGKGNSLRFPSPTGAGNTARDWKALAWDALTAYLSEHRRELGVSVDELDANPRIGVYDGGALIQIYARRVLGGVPVRGSGVTAVVNHGNLVLLAVEKWGNGGVTTEAALPVEEARAIFLAEAAASENDLLGPPGLELLPVSTESAEGSPGYAYRPSWVFRARSGKGSETWEGVVDARTGELLALEDANQYATRRVIGGVFPVSTDGVAPDGVEQAGYPMPYTNVVLPDFSTAFANGAGVVGCVPGSLTTSLQGLFVRIADGCGPISESSSADTLDLGIHSGSDCTTPALHSAGDTHAARSAYYALNRIIEQAKGHLPTNEWLFKPLAVNINLLSGCNAYWDGSSLNFVRENSSCRNTGEIASIVDHEWAHGLDNNGLNPSISRPAEGLAAIHSMLWLNEPCIARGFLKTGMCSGSGDACTSCTGIADADFARHASGLPHTLSWIGTTCAAFGSFGPCGREQNCEGQIVMETAWDLFARDLQASPFSYDFHTALEVATRLFYLAGQMVGDWYQCTPPSGGCPATGGYLNVLAADDDNGFLSDGTPHMTAIYAAFSRHQIHCPTPAAVNSGCAGGPTTSPSLTVTALDQGAALSWTAVSGAARYAVYRSEGVEACAAGKVKIGETTETSFTDLGLANGFSYGYAVLPIGATSACMGRMSTCVAATPAPGASLRIPDHFAWSVLSGDGDAFLDNCEVADVTFAVENDGAATLTNIRVVSVTSPTHPASVIATSLPSPVLDSLAACDTAPTTVRIVAQGMTFGDVLELEIAVTSDELAGATRSRIFRIANVEADLQPIASRTFSFDMDYEGWGIVQGTWTRDTAGGGLFYLSSSSLTDSACDVIRSPFLRLRADSTLSLLERFDIESPVPEAFDRANVAVRDFATGARTTISPTLGKIYDLPPGTPNGSCVTEGQAGWAGNVPTFVASVWPATALNPGGAFTGRTAQLEVAYGTDSAISGTGFDFDEVTLTNFDLLVPDAQTDTCALQQVAPAGLAVDSLGNGVLEPGELATVQPSWRNTGLEPVAASGAASGFGGPAGPSYTLADDTSLYGTIPVGDAHSCAAAGNCFALQIGAGTRPSLHFDASVDETISPTGTGKTWKLHVGDSFSDVPRSYPFYLKIETVLHNGITVGCTATEYCASQKVRRDQMAIFLARAIAGSPGAIPSSGTVGASAYDCTTGGTSLFSDIAPGNIACKSVHYIAAQNVTGGCGGGLFCPAQNVSRSEMSLFVARGIVAPAGGAAVPLAYGPDPVTGLSYSCDAGSPNLHFTDVSTADAYCKHVHFLWARGVIAGCTATAYCPGGQVGRGEMAKFLANAFRLRLYGP